MLRIRKRVRDLNTFYLNGAFTTTTSTVYVQHSTITFRYSLSTGKELLVSFVTCQLLIIRCRDPPARIRKILTRLNVSSPAMDLPNKKIVDNEMLIKQQKFIKDRLQSMASS